MDKLDSLHRRKRNEPQSTGKRLTPQPRDLMWFQKLQEHGPLPSSFLLAYSKHIHSNDTRAKERLTDLFHENHTPDNGSYLLRPAQQLRTIDSRYNQLVYDLTKSARKALEREGLATSRGNVNAGPWVHKLMVACITASVELGCMDRDDINYIPASKILKRADTQLRFPVTISLPETRQSQTKELIPDALFGLEYVGPAGNAYRFFVVEADRSTEPATTSNFSRKSFVRNLLQYQQYVERGFYKDHLGLTSPLMVLNVATDAKRKDKMLDVMGKRFPDGNSYMLFQHWEEFGEIFKPPDPNTDLLLGDWKRWGLESFNIGKG